jgi:hypothetical protein
VTTTIEHEVDQRKRNKQKQQAYTFAEDLLEKLRVELTFSTRVRFPSPLYQKDPVLFARQILGIRPWERQCEILEAVRDHPRVAVRSGHKIGKSTTAAILALWWYCSFDDARAIFTSTTSRQVDQILWRELRMLRARGGRCLECKAEDPSGLRITRPCEHSSLIDGEQGELARTGLKSADFREVVGFTAREAEAVAGISGKNLLYLPDEASGISDEIFEAIEGNRAGGARVCLFSNPTRNSGEFYDAFDSKKKLYKTLTVSSEEAAAVNRDGSIPGLATQEWIDEKKLEWGEDSAQYKIRVKGEHALHEEGKIFSVHTIMMSERRWQETEPAGRLFVGLDPAGETGTGDKTVFVPRRGLKMLSAQKFTGLNDEQHLVRLVALLNELKLPRETPVVVMDREGSIGSSLFGRMRNFLELPANVGMFELVAVRASDRAVRKPQVYDRMRDELVANLDSWFRDGGAIVEDGELAKELHQFEYYQATNGRIKVTPKDEIRKVLGRSPDTFDALALSTWEPLSLQGGDLPPNVAKQYDSPHDVEQVFDPYAAEKTWKQDD